MPEEWVLVGTTQTNYTPGWHPSWPNYTVEEVESTAMADVSGYLDPPDLDLSPGNEGLGSEEQVAISGDSVKGPTGPFTAPGFTPPLQKTPRLSLQHEMDKAAKWGRDTFPKAKVSDFLAKLLEEAGEVVEALNSPDSTVPQVVHEIGDVFIVLAELCDHLDVPPAQAVALKMEVNKARTWDDKGNHLGKKAKATGTLVSRYSDKNVLQEAQSLVDGDRRSDYGPIAPSFQRIATVWSGLLGIPIGPEQVALCMIGLKAARATQGFKRDSIVDIAGYAYCIERIQQEQVSTTEDQDNG